MFQIRNPWSFKSDKEKQLFNNFIQNYNDYIEVMDENNNINDEKLNKYLDNAGIFFLDKNQFKNYFRRNFICQILFDSTVYTYKLEKLENKDSLYYKLLYFKFEIYEK